MGPSGSGKSTLLHCIGGLERPASGAIKVAGYDIVTADETALTKLRRSVIGFVFQNFNLVNSLTAEQNVTLPLRLSGQQPQRQLVQDLLSKVGIGDRLKHRPRELSGGQQQRVAVARAMITRPEILLADEPTGALDSNATKALLALLRQVVVEQNQTIIMVTHDPNVAAAADSVVFLRDGRIIKRLTKPSPAAVAAQLADLETPAGKVAQS